MSTIDCPHCGKQNQPDAAFCEHCGMAISQASTGPRIVAGDSIASSDTGRQMQLDGLKKQASRASGILIAVGILQILFTLVLFSLLQGAPDSSLKSQALAQTAALLVVGIINICLGAWARKSPLPAASIGLALYVTLQIIQVVTNPEVFKNPIALILTIIIIVALARAVKAGVKHKKLQATMQATS